jgi:hypothetical protein
MTKSAFFPTSNEPILSNKPAALAGSLVTAARAAFCSNP